MPAVGSVFNGFVFCKALLNRVYTSIRTLPSLLASQASITEP